MNTRSRYVLFRSISSSWTADWAFDRVPFTRDLATESTTSAIAFRPLFFRVCWLVGG
ncbi:hypothetical protein PR202_ga12203 [Eleusine coracana subsp. coracana]|uniref:Uncharacterized protein n=1 Tax=Eleusine coracana subsp. coracana TaxID=191504 RepID=A0AAV5CBH6_ELECO|nr:hypothetical protein PR202_ga12203 [Eleusine coracana subsp. coracana]